MNKKLFVSAALSGLFAISTATAGDGHAHGKKKGNEHKNLILLSKN